MKKPRGIKVRRYVVGLIELNNYLGSLPGSAYIPVDEIGRASTGMYGPTYL